MDCELVTSTGEPRDSVSTLFHKQTATGWSSLGSRSITQHAAGPMAADAIRLMTRGDREGFVAALDAGLDPNALALVRVHRCTNRSPIACTALCDLPVGLALVRAAGQRVHPCRCFSGRRCVGRGGAASAWRRPEHREQQVHVGAARGRASGSHDVSCVCLCVCLVLWGAARRAPVTPLIGFGSLPQSGSDVLAHACAMEDPSFAWRLIREHGADPTLRRRGVRECAGQSRPAAGRGCGYRAEQPRL